MVGVGPGESSELSRLFWSPNFQDVLIVISRQGGTESTLLDFPDLQWALRAMNIL